MKNIKKLAGLTTILLIISGCTGYFECATGAGVDITNQGKKGLKCKSQCKY